MLIGLIGSLLPLGIIYFIYNNVILYVTERFEMLTKLLDFLPVEAIFQILLPVSIAMGVGIGFIGSIVTVRKHLRV